MNWSIKNIIERALSVAIFTFVGSFGGGEIVGGVPNSTQLRVALWATAMATLLSIAKNLSLEGTVVESTKRAAKVNAKAPRYDVADPAQPVQKTMRTRTKPVPPPKAGK